MTDKIPIDIAWGNAITIPPPDPTRIASGYVKGDGSPDASFSNFIQNRQDSYLKHLDERGMTAWSGHVLYDRSAFVWYLNQPYTAIVVNQGAPPATSPSQWRTLAVSVDNPLTDIKVWSGSVSTIPSGWLLCNGQNGTVDLSDRFIQSTNSSGSNVNLTGGTGGKTTTSNGAHTHYCRLAGGGSSAKTGDAGAHNHTIDNAGGHTHSDKLTDPSSLTTAQIPAHTHDVATRSGGNTNSGSGYYLDSAEYTDYWGEGHTHTHLITTDPATAHNHGGSITDSRQHSHTLPASADHNHDLTHSDNHTHTFPAIDPEHYVLCFITRRP